MIGGDADYGFILFIAKKDIKMIDDLVDAYSITIPNIENYKREGLTEKQKQSIQNAIADLKKDFHSMTINNFYSKYKLIVKNEITDVYHKTEKDSSEMNNGKDFSSVDKPVVHKYIKQQLIPLDVYGEAPIGSVTNEGESLYVDYSTPEVNFKDGSVFAKHVLSTRSFKQPVKDYVIQASGLYITLEQSGKASKVVISIHAGAQIIDKFWPHGRKRVPLH